MHFDHLEISDWQQFRSVSMDFHARLTILTGANGSGKTTLLSLLARHKGWQQQFLATPRLERVTGAITYALRYFLGKDNSSERAIGKLVYSDGAVSELLIPSSSGVTYDVQFSSQKPVNCFYIPSHRQIFRYQSLSSIPTGKKERQAAFEEVQDNNRNRYQGGGGQPSSFLMKNALISWVINGYGVQSGNKVVMPSDAAQVQLFEGFVDILRKVLPPTLKFEELEIRNMEVVLVCNDARDEFVLETVSGGVTALIDIAWQIFMASTKESADVTVIIDEVENHLHPTMQRRILPDLMNAFPAARFIVSTHSPLVVSSVKDSSVYVFTHDETAKVVSQKLDFHGEARTAAEILDQVLGVSFSMPIWAEHELARIVGNFQAQPGNIENLAELRSQLKEAGLERLMSSAVVNVLESRR